MYFLEEYEHEYDLLKDGFSTKSYSEKFCKKIELFSKTFRMGDNFSLGPLHFPTCVRASDAENRHLD